MLGEVEVEEDAGAEVVAEQVVAVESLAPGVVGVFAGVLGEHGSHVVVVPCVVESDTAYKDDVEEVVALLGEHVGEVEQQVDVTGDVVVLVGVADAAESSLRLPSVDVQTCTDGGCEEAADAEAYGRGDDVGKLGVGEGFTDSALQLDEVVRIGLVAQFLCLFVVGTLCRCRERASEGGYGEQ